ncbi:DNA repair protein RecO [Candidatus Rhabdochlamydia oedothoracis]|uniref:DNA repair protein RecO n=1 Tax=Candidatus Rhabdochlamydia oedothoracis TaxID=2720720 RepID=A0ABX8UZJ2_9BACT|nr:MULTISPECIES: DNA repair protein RecO [Rhabdochlamydia]KAG6559172.1 DNA repair protein RecO [Candidatus Rhabdochlamydia sp. W815]MCL6756634.1 DNA repair protein RecO [Candidatus Rhabdochlamydia oedothoracis]QYF48388.1 DNA repair protein RecO [Candidatus Rhabdochlamydia oedothoracis]
MEYEKTEGIVLRSLPYQDKNRIVTVFTNCYGVLQFIIKGISAKRTDKLALSSPLCKGEYLFYRGKGSLMHFVDGSVLSEHLQLRTKMQHIQAAANLVQIILTSQLPHKPAPKVYQFFSKCLKAIPYFENTDVLTNSFCLKLLKQEGLLALQPFCSQCEKEARALHYGESFCSFHAPKFSFRFSQEQWDTLLTLAYATTFSQIQNYALSKDLNEKINQIFQENT